jgi:hypothetical protein
LKHCLISSTKMFYTILEEELTTEVEDLQEAKNRK